MVHEYQRKQDIEIVGFWTSILAWGHRKVIISKSKFLFSKMGQSPYEFILNHTEKDRKKFLDFKHRTFQPLDTLFFLESLQNIYQTYDSLEPLFVAEDMTKGIAKFRNLFFDIEHSPKRTFKHIPSPLKKSTCKRINMFLRWMVRKDDKGIDFGIWNKISPSNLMIPLDVHVWRVARHLGLINTNKQDWNAGVELTNFLRTLDPHDPVKYDFALFGLGVNKSPLLNFQ